MTIEDVRISWSWAANQSPANQRSDRPSHERFLKTRRGCHFDMEERKRLREYREHDKVLQSLDHQDHHDLASHLLLAAKHRQSQPPSKRTRHGRKVAEQRVVITDPWTAWPLPSNEVPRPKPIPSSTATGTQTHLSSALQAELEATILRIQRT